MSKNEGAHFEKHAFLQCALFLGKKQIRENTCLKQHAFSVDPLGVLSDICIFKIPCVFDPKKGSQTKKKGLNPGAHVSKLRTPNLQRAHFDPKKGPKSDLSKGSELAGDRHM